MAELEGVVVGEEHEGEKEEQLEGDDDEKSLVMPVNRKEKRKSLKKMKRKQFRKEIAERGREEEQRRMNDPEEQRRLNKMEEEERLRMERDRKEFEERERKLLEEMERQRQAEEEEAERRNAQEEEEAMRRLQATKDDECEEDSNWEYVEGPPEIIWQGNEIIVRKKKVRVPKKNVDVPKKEDANRPTSNPFPPESEASSLSAQEMLKNVGQEVANFGTEQDKAHCPFHLKTGACRFGQRCSRVHFYPDKACTLLIKNMYSGPGIAWEQDEGLEHTDEEIERSYEEFYEDVHTEFLKYGQIVNFKVCRNSSYHLRGNVYVHYKSLDSALLAYQSFNGRYFAGKQVTCEFVNITRWKVAICGEYMKSRLQNCSRGNACNFIHCFRNPGGDYEWADWDKPPPRFWVEKMTALFGYSEVAEKEDKLRRTSSNASMERAHSRRSLSRDVEHQIKGYGRRRDREDYDEECPRQERSVDNAKRRTKNLVEEDGRPDKRLDSTVVASSTEKEYRRSSRARSSSIERFEEKRRKKDVISDDERIKGIRNSQPSCRKRTGAYGEEVVDDDRWSDRRGRDTDLNDQPEKESLGRHHGKRRCNGGYEKELEDDGNVSTKRRKQKPEWERHSTGSHSNRRRSSNSGTRIVGHPGRDFKITK